MIAGTAPEHFVAAFVSWSWLQPGRAARGPAVSSSTIGAL